VKNTWQAAATLAATCILSACSSDKATGTSDEMVRISFARQQSWCAGFLSGIVTVTELWGPSGATLSNTTPGKYMMRGTYNLPVTSTPSNVGISMSFDGSVTTAQGSQSVPQVDFSVPAGSKQGSFEVRGGFLSRTGGTGRPGVMASSGSSALDCVALY
jgi:hypothetical protein